MDIIIYKHFNEKFDQIICNLVSLIKSVIISMCFLFTWEWIRPK